MLLSRDDFSGFFTGPISATLLSLIVAAMFWQRVAFIRTPAANVQGRDSLPLQSCQHSLEPWRVKSLSTVLRPRRCL